jgi:O-antigen/teichoic acid export membrane protein
LNKTESHKFFDTDHLRSDLKARSIRGGAVTMTSQTIKFILQTGSAIILARLLTPQDYGLIAMVTAVTGFVALFKDIGLSMATIQNAKINQAQISTLFWINVAVSFVLALILAGIAPIISTYYDEPRLTWITLALAGTFILSGLTVQHQALLSRQMCFMAIAKVQIGSIGCGIITGVALAWYGAGYWALVGLYITEALSNTALVWIFCSWRPILNFRWSKISAMVKFGGQISGFDFVNYFARNFDNILIGRFWGANALGLYSRAYSVMMLPISQVRGPLNAVAMPALSHMQNEPVLFKIYYIKMITLIAFLTMPLMAFLFVFADQVIYLLLGSQWIGAVDIFKILCINAFIQPVSSTTGLVLVSLGQSKRYLNIGIITSLLIVISFILGLPWGAKGVATAYTIATYTLLVPSLWYCYKRSPISIKDFFLAISRPTIASMIMGSVIFLMRSYLINIPEVVLLSSSSVISFMTYIMVIIIIPGGLILLRDFLSYRNFLFKKN